MKYLIATLYFFIITINVMACEDIDGIDLGEWENTLILNYDIVEREHNSDLLRNIGFTEAAFYKFPGLRKTDFNKCLDTFTFESWVSIDGHEKYYHFLISGFPCGNGMDQGLIWSDTSLIGYIEDNIVHCGGVSPEEIKNN
ncbi:MAG: hypothetical protein VX642_09655 [Bdellovibrionota bacterium]|nr:hypothetical protein [Bdellovibrionota bacterium]